MTAYAKLLHGKLKVLQEQHIDARALIIATWSGATGERPVVADLYRAQEGLCFHCFEPMNRLPGGSDRNPAGWTREHVIPRSDGAGKKGNLVLAHPGCNQKRGTAPLSPIDAARARLITLAVRLARKRRGIASY